MLEFGLLMYSGNEMEQTYIAFPKQRNNSAEANTYKRKDNTTEISY
jgi:hypothetical protein